MGDHHFSLQVLADVAGRERDAGRRQPRLKPLNDHIALARSLLADTGMLVAREDLALEAAFWAQLPGTLPLRPRKAPITSRNFAAMAPFHNYPVGRASGNHWGDALSMFVTSARSPYHFSLHASDPNDPDGGSRKDTGHTLDLRTHRLGQDRVHRLSDRHAGRQGATQVIFDKDRGLEILVRALGRRISAAEERGRPPASIRCSCRPRRPISNFSKSGCASSARAAAGTARRRGARSGRSGSGAARHFGAGTWQRGACRAWSNSSIRPIRRVCMRGSRAGARRAAATTPGYSTTPATPWSRD